VERLVACDKFVLDRWQLDADEQFVNDNRFRILAVIEGCVIVAGSGIANEVRKGGTLLIPACCREIQMRPQGRAVVLEIYLP
jgi:mannose-6-phosphate isomerase class I